VNVTTPPSSGSSRTSGTSGWSETAPPYRDGGEPPLLRVTGLSKTFPGVKALDDVSLDVHAGEIVAVVGHNGSGKSTLVKILAGVYLADPGGTIDVRGHDGEALSGAAARNELHFIHQDLGLVGMLSSVENLSLGKRSSGPLGLSPVHRRAERRHAEQMIARFGAHFDTTVPIARLAAAERAIVAIARAMDGWTRPDKVLVLDEPTTAFHSTEVEVLFEAIRRIAADGAGVVFISHRLDEVSGLADRVVALRDGKVVANQPAAELDTDAMVQLIAGRSVSDARMSPQAARTAPALTVQGLSGPGVTDLDLTVRAGEIVGVSGILGSGREHLAPLLFGARPRFAGTIEVAGCAVRALSIPAAIASGMAYLPADRRGEGAVLDMNVRENLTLPFLRPLRDRFGGINAKTERAETTRWVERVEMRPALPERPVRLFSGGNQQKVLLAKWLRMQPKVMILDEPTQGVDVGAKNSIYQLIAKAAVQGTGVLVCSTETKELVTLCDRVIVLDGGRLSVELAGESLTELRLVREELALADQEQADRTPTKRKYSRA
jgi:ABC-type sugar transport system ATPase subunit